MAARLSSAKLSHSWIYTVSLHKCFLTLQYLQQKKFVFTRKASNSAALNLIYLTKAESYLWSERDSRLLSNRSVNPLIKSHSSLRIFFVFVFVLQNLKLMCWFFFSLIFFPNFLLFSVFLFFQENTQHLKSGFNLRVDTVLSKVSLPCASRFSFTEVQCNIVYMAISFSLCNKDMQ